MRKAGGSSLCVKSGGFFRAFLRSLQVRNWSRRMLFLFFLGKRHALNCFNLLKMVPSFDILIDLSFYFLLVFFNAYRTVNKRVNDLNVIGHRLLFLIFVFLWCFGLPQLNRFIDFLPLCKHPRFSFDVDQCTQHFSIFSHSVSDVFFYSKFSRNVL